ncbi:unnamed protein product [Pedinophyceae sp. YPF-701]|nr:unnamed protein product [Pedinophyceae sp. YPF-701]
MVLLKKDLTPSDELERRAKEGRESCTDILDDAWNCVRIFQKIEENYVYGRFQECAPFYGALWQCIKKNNIDGWKERAERERRSPASPPPPQSTAAHSAAAAADSDLELARAQQRRRAGAAPAQSGPSVSHDPATGPLGPAGAAGLQVPPSERPCYFELHKDRESAREAWLKTFGHLGMENTAEPPLRPAEMRLGPIEYSKFLIDSWSKKGGEGAAQKDGA